jgi:lysophospholipase L1-like esterase
VAFGDSITDGYQAGAGQILVENPSGVDENVRYPDFVASRLRASGRKLGVLNAGISGNKVLSDAATLPFGNAALKRFTTDALEQAGATDVVVLEGINDLGNDAALPASALIRGLDTLVRRAHAAGLRVHLATLTPAGGASQGYGTADTDKRRQQVNAWIRSRSAADGVIDFDRALRDPNAPSQLRPEYDSSDHLHPSTAGYAAMGRAVDLTAQFPSRKDQLCARP